METRRTGLCGTPFPEKPGMIRESSARKFEQPHLHKGVHFNLFAWAGRVLRYAPQQ